MKRLIVATLIVFTLISCGRLEYKKSAGKIFGTYYAITYQAREDLTQGMREVMGRVNKSLSTFDSTSVISKVNANKPVVLDTLFINMFNKAQEISALTGGAFDITVAPLVNAWGFGFDPSSDKKWLSASQVDSIMQFVGYKKVWIVDSTLVKADPRVQLDASAIAKGYGCDLVAEYLRSQGCENFMVDIGGELVVSGVSPRGTKWRVGVSKPENTSEAAVAEVMEITDCAVATSGNYRQFYYTEDGMVGHTIDPRTGRPAVNNIVSATIIAPTCMEADALATASMVVSDSLVIRSWGRDSRLIYK
jgi:thiamine biosynthesis lipoprotein